MAYYIDQNFIGEIDLDIILTEEQLSTVNVSKLGKLKIYVYGAEGKIPHMHLFNRSIDFEACLMLYEAKYFIHGNKNGTFNSKQLRLIDEFLRSNYVDSPLTNWQVACIMWDGANNDHKFRYTNKQPDYKRTQRSVH